MRLTPLAAQGLVFDWADLVGSLWRLDDAGGISSPRGANDNATLLHYNLMDNGTKWIVGTGVAIITAIVGSAVAVVAVVVTLAGDIRADLRDVRADLRDVRASVDSLDARLRAVEVGFGKVDQRLLTIERVVLPPSPPGE